MAPWLIVNADKIAKWPPQPPFRWRRAWDAERYWHQAFEAMRGCRDKFNENGLSRDDVVDLFRVALDAPEKRSFAIVAALLWGGISTGGRMGDRLFSILQLGEDPLISSFTCALENLRLHQIDKAYECLQQRGAARIPNVGQSYFTKILFFLGLAMDIHPVPLILDKWTGNAYAMLLLDSGNLEDFERGFSRNRVNPKIRSIPTKESSNLYTSFVRDMNRWADQLGIAPDHLEQFLFGTDLRKNRSADNPRLMIWNELLKSLKRK